ncbi:MAG: MFS transporter [Legionellaceae bacterium]|nr:MFS transporter [Legionellaceae bacterium]
MNTNTAKKQKIAAALGNLLEWYDFALYGYFAEEIGAVFFPKFGEGGLLASFVVFAIGFLSRPLGAVLFGYLGDRHGRRITLLVVFPLMFFSTAIIGILPTYQQIGIWSQVLLILVRILQGMSVGCQYTTSITYLSEMNGKNKNRAMVLSSPWIFSNLGFILAALVTYFYFSYVIEHVSESWQWRIPFLTSLLGIPFLIWQKVHLRETPDFKHIQKNNKIIDSTNPLDCVHKFPRSFFTTVAMSAVMFVSYYVLFVYLVSNSMMFKGLPKNFLIIINIIALAVQTICIPLFAKLSDKISPKRVYYGSAGFLLLVSYPAFLGFELNIPMLSLIILSFLAAICAGFCASISVLMVDAYPTQYRLSGTSIGYNISAALFGGTAPMVATILTSSFHDITAPGLYISFWCVLGIIGALMVKDFRRYGISI